MFEALTKVITNFTAGQAEALDRLKRIESKLDAANDAPPLVADPPATPPPVVDEPEPPAEGSEEFVAGDLGIEDFDVADGFITFKLWHTHGVPSEGHFEIRPFLERAGNTYLIQIKLEPNEAGNRVEFPVSIIQLREDEPEWLRELNPGQALTCRLYTHEGDQLGKFPLGNANPSRVTLNLPEIDITPPSGKAGKFRLDGMTPVTIAKSHENEEIWTRPLFEIFQSTEGVPCQVLSRPTGNLSRREQEQSRHAYSVRDFESSDGAYGLSNGTGVHRVWRFGNNPADLGLVNFGVYTANWVPHGWRHDGELHPHAVFGLDTSKGAIAVVDVSGERLYESPPLTQGIAGSNWSVSGSSGTASSDGWVCIHPISGVSGGNWKLVLFNLFTQQKEVVDLSKFDMPSFTTGSQSLSMDNACLHQGGKFIVINPNSTGGGSDGDRGYILERTDSGWKLNGWTEGGHGDTMVNEHGQETWAAIGWDHNNLAPGGRTGVFECQLGDPSKVRTVQGLTRHWNNSPLSMGGHLSGLASQAHPGLAAISVSDPEGGRHIGLISTAQEGVWHHVDSLPTSGSYYSYQTETQAALSRDGQRIVAACKRKDYPEQPMLVRYFVGQFFDKAA